jgi:hypothetical protein
MLKLNTSVKIASSATLLAVFFAFTPAQSAYAACASDFTGSATLDFSLPTAATADIWVKARVTTLAKLAVNIDTLPSCQEASSILPNTAPEWVKLAPGSMQIASGSHTAYIYSYSGSASLSDLLLAEPGCTPVGDASNCITVASTAVATPSTPTTTPPSTPAPAATSQPKTTNDTTLQLSPKLSDPSYIASVSSVDYLVNGSPAVSKPVENGKATAFSTANLTNGTYTITEIINKKDGSTETLSRTFEVYARPIFMRSWWVFAAMTALASTAVLPLYKRAVSIRGGRFSVVNS